MGCSVTYCKHPLSCAACASLLLSSLLVLHPHNFPRHHMCMGVDTVFAAAGVAVSAAAVGQVFLQSDVFDAVAAMRDEFEQYAGDVLQLSPLHSTAAVFHWTRDQEAAAAAAAKQAPPAHNSSSQTLQQQREQQQQRSVESDVDTPTDSYSEGSGSASDDEDELPDGEQFISTWAAGGWLVENPLGVPTEREHYVQAQGGKVFRVLLVKK